MKDAQTKPAKVKGQGKIYSYVLSYAIWLYVNLCIFYAFLRGKYEF